MKILPNIIPAFKIYGCLRYLNAYKKQIEEGRAENNIEKEKAGILSATSTWGKKLLSTFGTDLVINGRENLPTEGPVVYVANHQGYADIPSLCAALDTIQYGFVAKSDLEKVPLYGSWIKRIRSILIERGDHRSSLRTINEGIDLIKQGYSLLIFPEGTRSKGGPVKEFKKGSLRLATKPGVPIIPVTVNGTSDIFEKYGCVKSGCRVEITIHPAIKTSGLSRQELNELQPEVQRIVESALPPEKRSENGI